MSASAQVALRLRDIAHRVALECLPHGQLEDDEILAGDITGRPGRSLRVRVFGDPRKLGLWADFAGDHHHRGDLLDLIRLCLTNGDRSAALARAREFLDGKFAAREPVETAPAPRRRPVLDMVAIARRLWGGSVQIGGTLAEVHLTRDRGVDPSVAGVLRFHHRVWHKPLRRFCPAVLAPVVGVDRRFRGVHRLYLESDGRQLDHPDPKRALGDVHGGHVPLSQPLDGDDEHHLTEGVEDGLALLTAAPQLWVQASVSASHLHQLDRDPRAAVTFVHHDDDPAGHAGGAAFRAHNGDHPDIILTPPPFKDLNALLQVQGRTGVQRHLELAAG